MFCALEFAGTKLPVRSRPEGQPFYLAAIEELLRISGDPDHRAFYSSSVSFAHGVRVGFKAKTPRVPAVFDRKTKWRKYEEEECDWRDDRQNYVSARDHAAVVQRQFEEEEKLGAMLQLDLAEAHARFGEQIAVASLGAIDKKNGTFRVVHDGTHGVGINPGIKMRDQLKSPCAGDIRAVMQELPGCYFGLTGDVARAHRLVKVAEADWGLMACKTGRSSKIWVNRVGSFGISSAAYHWSRLMSGVGRAVYYALGKSELFLLVYVDDLLWLVREAKGLELIVMSIFYLEVLGLPFAWKKFKGGLDVEWVGFQICLKRREAGFVRDPCTVANQLAISNCTARHSEDLRSCICCWALVLRTYSTRALEAILGPHLRLGCSHEWFRRVQGAKGFSPDLQVFGSSLG